MQIRHVSLLSHYRTNRKSAAGNRKSIVAVVLVKQTQWELKHVKSQSPHPVHKYRRKRSQTYTQNLQITGLQQTPFPLIVKSIVTYNCIVCTINHADQARAYQCVWNFTTLHRHVERFAADISSGTWLCDNVRHTTLSCIVLDRGKRVKLDNRCKLVSIKFLSNDILSIDMLLLYAIIVPNIQTHARRI